MPQVATKASKISSELTVYLTEGERLDDISFRRYLRDIDALKDHVVEDYLKALAFGAYGRVDDAIAHFELSLKTCRNEVVAKNFLVYLSDFGTLRKSFLTSIELAEQFVSPFIYLHAYENCIFQGQMDLAEKYYHSYSKLFSGEELDSMENKLEDVLFDVNYFKEVANLSGNEYELLLEKVTNVLDEHKVHPSALKFYGISEEKVNAMILVAKTSDVEKLADMNVELAFLLAEYDCLIQKNFSVWFEAEEDHIQADKSDSAHIARGMLNVG